MAADVTERLAGGSGAVIQHLCGLAELRRGHAVDGTVDVGLLKLESRFFVILPWLRSRTLEHANGPLQSMGSIVRSNDYKIGDTVDNLREATDNLNQLTNSVKQRPWSLLRIKQSEDRKVPK